MKKLIVIGLLLSLSTGCGRGWLPCLFRGAGCGNGSCIGAAPALPQGCTTCVDGSAAGYGSYDGEVIGDSYIGSGVITDNYLGGGTVVPSAPSMQALPGPTAAP